MRITRHWAMPNRNTFDIAPVRDLIFRYKKGFVIDPFANTNRIADHCNDLDPAMNTEFCMDALLFLRSYDASKVDTVLFDPPYSPRQVSEVYKHLGKTVNMQTTQASFWSAMKKEISRITASEAIVITCGWNSGGIGEKYGFDMQEILLVPHGGWHNDTIVTVEQKAQTLL